MNQVNKKLKKGNEKEETLYSIKVGWKWNEIHQDRLDWREDIY